MTTSVDELYGLDVHAADGKLLGKVDDIYLDDVTARPTIARVKHGLAGRKVWLVPIVSATRQASGLVVPYAEATIEHAPLVEPRDHITAEQEAQLLDYYGIALESITRPPVAGSPGVAGSSGVAGGGRVAGGRGRPVGAAAAQVRAARHYRRRPTRRRPSRVARPGARGGGARRDGARLDKASDRPPAPQRRVMSTRAALGWRM